MKQNDFNFKDIRLIVGLGNIGDNYNDTRHNVGFLFVDAFSEFPLTLESKFEAETVAIQMGDHKLILSKPTTLMNNSGRSVSKIMKYFNIEPNEILVVHDDLDIELGSYKLQFDKGPKGHNGIISIEKSINTSAFWRLRIGIDSRSIEIKKNLSGADYVLNRFNTNEKEQLYNTLEKIKEDLVQ